DPHAVFAVAQSDPALPPRRLRALSQALPADPATARPARPLADHRHLLAVSDPSPHRRAARPLALAEGNAASAAKREAWRSRRSTKSTGPKRPDSGSLRRRRAWPAGAAPRGTRLQLKEGARGGSPGSPTRTILVAWARREHGSACG